MMNIDMTTTHDRNVKTVHRCLMFMADNDSALSRKDREYANYITSEIPRIYEAEHVATEAADELLMTIGDTFGYATMDSLDGTKTKEWSNQKAYDNVVIDGCTAELIYGNCIVDSPDSHSAAMVLQSIERDITIEQATYIVERIQEELDV